MNKAAVIALCGLMACRRECVHILEPTALLNKPVFPTGTYTDSTYRPYLVSILQPGEELQVYSETYGKDFLAYRVRTRNGRDGYVLYDSQAVGPLGKCSSNP
jgi:hypothetical protein